MHTQDNRHIQSTQGEPIIVVMTGTYITSSTSLVIPDTDRERKFSLFGAHHKRPTQKGSPRRMRMLSVYRVEHTKYTVVTAKVAIVKLSESEFAWY